VAIRIQRIVFSSHSLAGFHERGIFTNFAGLRKTPTPIREIIEKIFRNDNDREI